MNKSRKSKLEAEASNVSAAELAKFAELAERPAMDGRAGVTHQGRF